MPLIFDDPKCPTPPWRQTASHRNLKTADFRKISELLYKYSGIRLKAGKEELVRSRLVSRLHALGIRDFGAYLRHIHQDESAKELRTLIDCLTTNKTSFFREKQHFDFMRTHMLPDLIEKGGRLRIWSAGCSSGEEPYSIAMLLSDHWPAMDSSDIRILATDISDRMLAKARSGVFEKAAMGEITPACLLKYFTANSTPSGTIYTINEKLRHYVRFARLNLMDDWPMKGPFDIIFCRNVMIYFDSMTQKKLVRKFYELLVPGGYFLVGHSESLLANAGGFKYVRPATYIK